MGFVVGLRAGEISISLRKSLSDFLASGKSRFGSFDIFFFKILEVKIVDDKSSRNDMILVDILNKRLNSGSLDEFLLVDSSLDISRIAGDTDDQEVRESIFLQ